MTTDILEVLAGCMLGALMVGLHRARPRGRRRRMARHPAPTFVFADLVGYSALTEQWGDQAAAHMAREFRHMISNLSREHGAWHVKTMGDGAMIWVPDATQAVALAARTLSEVGMRPDMLPVRIGAHTGPAVMDDGDWYGGAVNVAARLARAANVNEALVSDATHSVAGRQARGSLDGRAVVGLRGLSSPIVAWRLAPEPLGIAGSTR
jgi:adenylate cyclase